MKEISFNENEKIVDDSNKLKCRKTCDNGGIIVREKSSSLYSHITGEEELH